MEHYYPSTCNRRTGLLLLTIGVFVLLCTYEYVSDKNAFSKNLNWQTLDVREFSLGSKSTGNAENTDDMRIENLINDLKHKLNNVIPKAKMTIPETCKTKISIERSCNKTTGCLRLGLPESLKSRMEQIVKLPQLHYSDKYKDVFEDMATSVPGYFDIILATAASSNHYRESMALLYNLRKFVYPYLKNFTLIYYDIGLSKAERQNMTELCQCHIRSFPFSRFPKFFNKLKCYTWKPMIINAHVSKGNLLHWMDSSIRFNANISNLEMLYHHARAYGMQSGAVGNPLAPVTLKSMFHFFGDEPCSYHYYRTLTASFIIFNNEPFIREAVLRPWVACALDEACMCPYKQVNIAKAVICPLPHSPVPVNEYAYGTCHRFDQSALTIIVRKLFQEKSSHFLRPDIKKYIAISRGDLFLVT